MTTDATAAADIVYPETDGMPLPDGEYQAPLYIRIVGTLRTFFRDVAGARVNGDTFIYYVQGDPRRFFSPDCYVALGLGEEAIEAIERNNTYLLWEMGKPPDFILEIGSPSTADVDVGSKRELYAEIGVGEYWRYDGTGGDFYGEALVGERLADGEYERLEMRTEEDGSVWCHSAALNLDLWWVDGELRFWDPVGEQWLLSHEEEHDGRLEAQERVEVERGGRLIAEAEAESAQERAESAQARLEAERDGRLAAEARASQLEAELRRLRGE